MCGRGARCRMNDVLGRGSNTLEDCEWVKHGTCWEIKTVRMAAAMCGREREMLEAGRRGSSQISQGLGSLNCVYCILGAESYWRL